MKEMNVTSVTNHLTKNLILIDTHADLEKKPFIEDSNKIKELIVSMNNLENLMISTSERSIEQIPVLVSIKLIFSTFAQRLRKISLTQFLTPSINI